MKSSGFSGDLREILWVPLRSQGYCGVGKDLSGLHWVCVRPHRRQPTRLRRPWDSPGKNTGVGCHFFLQCMKVKSESEVTQSCPTLCDPIDGSPPGSPVPGILQARTLEWAPGKSGLHARGEGERVLALESREGTRASRRVEEGLSRSLSGGGAPKEAHSSLDT